MFHIFCSESISISLSRADNFFKIIWFYFTCSHVLTFTLTCHAKCLFIFIFILFIYILLLFFLFFIFYFLFESFYLYSLALMTEPFCILVLRYTINSYKTRNERQGIKTTNFFFFFFVTYSSCTNQQFWPFFIHNFDLVPHIKNQNQNAKKLPNLVIWGKIHLIDVQCLSHCDQPYSESQMLVNRLNE